MAELSEQVEELDPEIVDGEPEPVAEVAVAATPPVAVPEVPVSDEVKAREAQPSAAQPPVILVSDADASEPVEDDLLEMDSEPMAQAPEPGHSPPPLPSRAHPSPAHPARPASQPPRPLSRRATGAPSPPDPDPSPSIHPAAYGTLPPLESMPAPVVDRKAVAQELLDLCQSELRETRDKARRARLHFECGRLLEMPLGQWEAALEHYQQARTLAAKHAPTLAGLRRVRMLRGEWEAAQKILSEELEVASAPAERAAICYLRGVIFEQRLGRLSEARNAYALALAQLPGDAASLRALLRAARQEKKPEEVRKLLERLAESAGDDPGLLASRLSTRARVAEQREHDPSDVLAFHQRSVDVDPLATASLAHAERLMSAGRHFQQLLGLSRRKVQLLIDSERRAAVLVQGAELAVERLGDRASAIGLLEQAAQETPDDAVVLRRLADLYHVQGDHTGELQNLLKLENLEAEPAEKVELRLRIAELYRHRLDSLDDAIVWFEKARELAPTHPGAADSLAALYRQGGDWQGLVRVLTGREAASDDTNLRTALNLELAELLERKLEDSEQAIARLKSAVGLAPDHPGAFRELSRLLHEQRRFAELVEVHEAAHDRCEEPAEAISHLLAVAQISEDLLGLPGKALTAYQRILEREPGNLLAMRGVQRVAVTAGQPEVAIRGLEQEVELLRNPAAKVPLLVRAAEIAERQLGSVEKAVEAYQRVVQLAPGCRPALSALARIYRAQGQYSELIGVMQLELDTLHDRHLRAEQLLRIGQIAEDLLADDGLALETYRRALAESPESRHAAGSVERSLQRRGEHAALARLLETRLRHEKDERQKLMSALELARIYEVRLDKPKEALHAYSIAAAADEGSQVAQDGKARMLALLGEHQALAATLDQQAEDLKDPASVLWALLLGAEVLEERLGQPLEAAVRYERVLAQRPGHRGALDNLERIYSDLGLVEQLRGVLVQQADCYDAVGERLASLRELSRVHESDDADAEAARVSAARQVLQLAPEDERALLTLELAHVRQLNLQGLAEVDRVRLASTSAPELRSLYRTRLGEYLEAHNPEQALLMHRPALSEDPENIGAARGVTRLAEQLGKVELLTEAAEVESRVLHSQQRASVLFRTAARLEVQARRWDEAAGILSRCLNLHPDDAGCASDLHQLLTSLGRHEELISILQDAAANAHEPDVRAGHLISVARLLANVRQDLPAAIAALLRVEKSQPAHVPTLVELAELYIRDRQWAAAALRLEKTLSASSPEKVELPARLRLAEIYHEHLDRTSDATRLLREVLRSEPENRSALRRLLYLEVAEGKASARDTAEAWVRVSHGAELAEALTTLGRLQRDARQAEQALASLSQAIELVGYLEDGAGRDLARLFESAEKRGKRPDWTTFTRALEKYCNSDSADGDRARSHLELARAYFDHLAQHPEGIAALRRGLVQAPESVDLLRELAERLVSMRQFDAALPELVRWIRYEPNSRTAWAHLVETFDALGRNAEAHLGTGALVQLGAGSDLQRSTWAARQARPAYGAEGSVNAALRFAQAGGLPDEAQALLSQMSPLLFKVFPQDLARLGLSTKQRIAAKAVHPLRPLLDRIVRLFRGVEVDLYVGPSGSPVSLVLADPVGIVVPAEFGGLREVEQTFCLARAVCAIATDQQFVFAQGAGGTARLLLASCLALGVQPPGAGAPAAEVQELSRRISKALPWLAKGRFEEAARRYATLGAVDLSEGAAGMQHTAFRVALLLSDDVGCLDLLRRDGRKLFGLSEPGATQVYLDLLAFWVSDEAMQFRRTIGLI